LLFAMLPIIFAMNASATTYPTLSISQNPVPYGQTDKINATALSTSDRIAIFVNSTMVAGPAKGNVNYTICVTSACLLPGTYGITSEDLDTLQTSQTRLLSVTPVLPQVYIQKGTANYGDTDQITVVAPHGNDTIVLSIDGSSPVSYSSVGSFTYTVCNYNGGMPCLPVGNHTVSVSDSTENVHGVNQSLRINLVLPQLSLSTGSASYGSPVRMTVTAPSSNDSVELIYSNVTANATQLSNQTIFTGTGSFTYTICASPANTTNNTCIPAGKHNIRAWDHTEGAWSVNRTLNVMQVPPQLSMLYTAINYAAQDKIYVTSPLAGDMLKLMVNNTTVTQNNNGSFTYSFCNIVSGTVCMAPGTYNVIVFDDTQKAYSQALQLLIKPVPPSLLVDYTHTTYGAKNLIRAVAPLYNDSLTLIINNVRYVNSTGNITLDMCPHPQAIDCFSAGTYNITAYDLSENVYSQNKTVVIAASSGPSTTVPTTSIAQSTSSAPTTITIKGPTGVPNVPAGTIELVVGMVIALIVAAVLIRFYLNSRKPPEEQLDTTY
ncbi:MAG: hypothetical protein KGH50_02725, partial [Candidatus Micrarchaeota archaeon]|nr:hypothetical protein [Candidatus Micrarchaeota archaeon]